MAVRGAVRGGFVQDPPAPCRALKRWRAGMGRGGAGAGAGVRRRRCKVHSPYHGGQACLARRPLLRFPAAALHPFADDGHDGNAGVEGHKGGHLHRPAPAAQPRALGHERVDQLHQHHIDEDACQKRGEGGEAGCWRQGERGGLLRSMHSNRCPISGCHPVLPCPWVPRECAPTHTPPGTVMPHSAPVEMESKMPSTSSVVCAFWLKLSRTPMPGGGEGAGGRQGTRVGPPPCRTSSK